MAPKRSWEEDQAEGQVLTEEEYAVKEPNLYRVMLLNDDYTPMEFVVWILQIVFHKPYEESVRLMMDVHTKGKGVCGVFTYDIAQTKVRQVQNLAKQHEHPLQCVMEVVESC